MIPVFGGFSGGRISDLGFWTVVVVAILAGATIIMGMKLAFEDEPQSCLPEQAQTATIQMMG